jgi:cation diffusion facilitator CzcD-associated flavoprotein CzcO
MADVEVAIIGSGFSGLGTGIKLLQDGMQDFVVIERGGDVGGTWHYNTYPGCACDVPSHLYSFSFALNPGWSQTYSTQPEIRDYLRRCADEFGVRPFIRFNREVTAASWDGDCWRLETTKGPLSAKVLVVAAGPLTEPRIPAVPGLDSFEGTTFHSARWNHDHDLTGERVAAVGTGASAIQFVPAIQPKVAQLHVFQRTPPWVVPHTNRNITDLERRLFRAVPAAQKALRGGIYTAREALVLGFVKQPRLMRLLEGAARKHIERHVSEPELRERLMPSYTIGCKRILPSNRWYPALDKPNVELIASAIREVRPHSIVAENGVEREVDTIVWGTGFHVTDMPVGRLIRGRDGRTLAETWQGSPRAHLGTAVAGFPNLFVLLGPNTGLGHNSMIYMAESQIAHVLDALRAMRRSGAGIVEVRPEAQARYNAAIDDRMQRTVWSTGCSSWYLDRNGRNSTLWPDWTWRFRRRAAKLDPSEYELATAAA